MRTRKSCRRRAPVLIFRTSKNCRNAIFWMKSGGFGKRWIMRGCGCPSKFQGNGLSGARSVRLLMRNVRYSLPICVMGKTWMSHWSKKFSRNIRPQTRFCFRARWRTSRRLKDSDSRRWRTELSGNASAKTSRMIFSLHGPTLLMTRSWKGCWSHRVSACLNKKQMMLWIQSSLSVIMRLLGKRRWCWLWSIWKMVPPIRKQFSSAWMMENYRNRPQKRSSVDFPIMARLFLTPPRQSWAKHGIARSETK